jgi:hypothetical protein
MPPILERPGKSINWAKKARTGLILAIALAFMLFGCAETQVKEESTESTPDEIMYERSQKIQQQMMQQNRPYRLGPGSR